MAVKPIIPLVLHRVVADIQENFEDITIPTLEIILDRIGECWIAMENIESAESTREKGRWLLTFDDGYASDYEIVFPRLQARRQRACFFLIADRVGKPGYLTWEQVREMRRYGMEFGSHGLRHRSMTGMTVDEAGREFSTSRARIEENLGEKIRAFSFPYGCYNRGLVRMARAEGFRICCTSDHGVCQPSLDIVPRNAINGSMGCARIAKTLEASVLTRCVWRVEDVAKKVAKRCLSETVYKKLRQSVAG